MAITKKDKKASKKKSKVMPWVLKITVFISAFLLTSGILIVERQEGMGEGAFKIGEPAPRTLFAPFEIAYEDALQTKALQRERSSKIPFVYQVDSLNSKVSLKKIDDLFDKASQAKATEAQGQEPQIDLEGYAVSEEGFEYLYEDADLKKFRETLAVILGKTYQEGLLSYEHRVELLSQGESNITIISEKGEERTQTVSSVRLKDDASSFALSLLPQSISRSKSAKRSIMEVFDSVLEPNLVFNAEETERRKAKAVASVEPIQEVIKKDELIVQRGRLVTFDEKQRIDQIQAELEKHKKIDKLSGIGLLVFLTYLLSFLYVFYFEKKTFASTRQLVLINVVFVLTVAISKVIVEWPNSSPYLMPTALAPLLLALLLPVRLGILASAVMSIFAALLTGFQPDVAVGTLAAGIAGTFSALRLRKRLEFLKLGLAVGFAYFLVLFAFQIYFEYGATESLQVSALGFANGLLITIPLCFLILPILEGIFNLITDITLLELSDLNHPLLKRMIVEAPGTYHHSLVVSTLSESACEQIGANALLARVGCYFHDIGKIAKAEFFTENQRDQVQNKHETMSPSMSSFIIMDHVKGGIALGKQHKLKQRILDFIPEHHGTQVIYYFYRKALDSAKPGEKVSADDFRYSGPKPQSRETAVALLADSTEAASRSLKEVTPHSIRQLVRKIINDKFIDGQLDECDLTLRDLHKIQDSFVQNLMAIYHTRVSYPKKPDVPGRPDLFKEDPENFHHDC